MCASVSHAFVWGWFLSLVCSVALLFQVFDFVVMIVRCLPFLVGCGCSLCVVACVCYVGGFGALSCTFSCLCARGYMVPAEM